MGVNRRLQLSHSGTADAGISRESWTILMPVCNFNQETAVVNGHLKDLIMDTAMSMYGLQMRSV